jgi:Glycosyl transferase family 2
MDSRKEIESVTSIEYSVITSTRNRARSLRRALQALVEVNRPPGVSLQVIVVDNGSSDDTAEVVRSFAGLLPITYVYEPNPGVSNARNAGVAVARGEYILWSDDDIVVDRGWLEAYFNAFQRHPEAAVFGCKVVPLLEEPAPSWFRDAVPHLGYLLAVQDFGSAPVMLSVEEDRLPFGGFAVKTEVQKRHRYDPNLGITPGRRRGGEETAVLQAILSEGNTGWYVPDAIARHIIPHSRQTIAYVKKFYAGMGQAWALSELAATSAPVLKAPVQTWIKTTLAFARLQLAGLVSSKYYVPFLTSYSFHRAALAYFLAPVGERI